MKMMFGSTAGLGVGVGVGVAVAMGPGALLSLPPQAASSPLKIKIEIALFTPHPFETEIVRLDKNLIRWDHYRSVLFAATVAKQIFGKDHTIPPNDSL